MGARGQAWAAPARAGEHHRSRARMGLVLAVIVAAVAGTIGTGTGTPATAQTPPNLPSSYVALGDSFTAGPLIPNQVPDPIGCLRSDRDYPHLVAPISGYETFRDVSCSGARTDHMFGPQDVSGGPHPPQLDALDAGTLLVTLGIGGNDIGFSEIIQNCIALLPFGSPCQDRYVPGGEDEISRRIAETAPKVGQVLAAIAERSPDATVLVVGYPAIAPHTGSGCWPSFPLAWDDVPYLREKHEELNVMLAGQADAHGATYVDTYTPSAGRDACAAASVRWVEPLVPMSPAAPVHPNARGMEGMAGIVRANL